MNGIFTTECKATWYISDYFSYNVLALKILFRIQMEKPKIKISISLETTILIEAGTRILYFSIA